MDKQGKVYNDEELRDYVYELKQIIRKLLFQQSNESEHFRNNVPEIKKQEALNEYIAEQIDNQIL